MNPILRCAVWLALMIDAGLVAGQEPTVRSTAVVDLSFDEVNGLASDRAAAGTVNDIAQPKNGAERVSSPFWNVTSGRALRIDDAAKQTFEVADSADLDHAGGTTLSFYFLNLHPLDDKVFHGILAKRQPNDQGSKTNYGLNFQPSSGNLQVYVHAGAGFKVVRFPVEAAFGVRRRAHLMATFRPADAPEPDTDTDADDLEIRLFVNGKPLKPTEAGGGPVTTDAGWLVDVDAAALPNDAALSIGSSFPDNEVVSGLIDELLIFNRALSIVDAGRLFTEVAGSDGQTLAVRETEAVPSTKPVVAEVDLRGLQIGKTSRLTITGKQFGNEPEVLLSGVESTIVVQPESTGERLVVDVTVAENAIPSLGLLTVRTGDGLSEAVPLPVDRLVQNAMPTDDEPVTLPAAFSGTLNGSDRPRIVFDGTRGQAFVAEVELKRLGGKADPVLELKSESGVPIAIAWGRSIRSGDPRLIATLPDDGRYALELHDLAYQASPSRFRILAGELHLVDSIVPAAIESGTTRNAVPVGVGLVEPAVAVSTAEGHPTAILTGKSVDVAQGVLPVVPIRFGRVLSESEANAGPVDVTQDRVTIAGELAEDREVDRFILNVAPGKPVEIQVAARTLGSPVEPVVTIVQGDRELGRDAAKPGTGTATVRVTPPASDGAIEVRVADRLSGQENVSRHYEIKATPDGLAEFQVTLLDSAIALPKSGRGIARFRVTRRGPTGEIRLIPAAGSNIVLEPDRIAAGPGKQDVFVSVKSVEGTVPTGPVTIVAESDTPAGTLRRPVRVTPSSSISQFDPARPVFQAPVAVVAAVPSIELTSVPAVVFRGTTATIGLSFSGESLAAQAMRFSLVTDERPRPVDPAKPNGGNKPLVRLPVDSAVSPGVQETIVDLVVPADVAANEIRGVIKGEVVPHAWSMQTTAIGYSTPLSLAVKDAIVAASAAASTLKPGENELRVTLQREAGFESPVRVELRGLPEGWTAKPSEVDASAAEATVAVTVPGGAAAGAVPNVELAVLAVDGTVLKAIKPFALTVQP